MSAMNVAVATSFYLPSDGSSRYLAHEADDVAFCLVGVRLNLANMMVMRLSTNHASALVIC